jgi:hypothetical protein
MPEGKNAKNLFLETLDWICNKLQSLHIPYMITGGSAVGFWGNIRTTMDIDMVVQIRFNQIDNFLEAIKDEAYVDIQTAKESVQSKSMFNIIPNETLFKIDIIPLDESNAYQMQNFKRKVKMEFEGKEIYVISPEDLIISKLIWSKIAGGSERQIRDCESIWNINQDNIDTGYINKWIDVLNLKDEFKKINL